MSKKKSKVVMVDGIPIKPISAAEHKRLDSRIRKSVRQFGHRGFFGYVHGGRRNSQTLLPKAEPLMGEWKIGVTLRMRGNLRAEMIAFAEQEKRSLGNLCAILLEWSFVQLKEAGSTTRLLGQSAKRLNKLTRDRRLQHG
jgi:hypothetical protein